jgi:large subunit ribosomal protein L25
MSQDIITVTKRETIGKAANREVRKAGDVPAVIYGLGKEPIAVAVNAKATARVIASDSGLNSLIEMQIQGAEIDHVIIKDVARFPVSGRLMHIDFMRVDPTHKVRVKVPIRLKGTPLGVKEGGMLDFIHREIEVECLPAFIPAHIDVEVAHLLVDESLRMEQLNLDDHLTLLGDHHNVICIVHGKQAPTAEELAAATPEPVVAAKK